MNKAAYTIRRTVRRDMEWWVFLVVPLVGTIVFSIIPLLGTFAQSMQNTAGNPVGIVNYQILLKDAEFRSAIVNTLYMGLLGVGFSIPLAFIFAYMLNRVPYLRNMFKTFFLLPMIISMVAVAMIFKYIFSADPAGIVNYVLGLFGIPPQTWFANPAQTRETVIIMTLWKSLGHSVILFYAGLQTLPTELYEASDIDGANEWNKLVNITIPCMRNTLIFVYITNTIGALRRFTDVYAISGEYGYPNNRLITIMLYVYRKSFSTLFFKDTGLAASASVVLFVLIMLITSLNWKLTGENAAGTDLRRRRRISA